MGNWQSMETAPKDGTPVLCYGETAGEISGPMGELSLFIADYSGEGDYKGFEWSVQGGDYYTVWAAPTHWQPLPNIPVQP